MLNAVTSVEPGPSIGLRPMTHSEFDEWREIAIAHHASQTSRATGQTLEASLEQASALLPRVLVAGLDTEGMNFFVVVDDAGMAVGWLWLGLWPDDLDTGFVWDIIVDEAHRGNGYGRAAMVAAERFFAAQGKLRMGLQISGGNDLARHLYESMGYHDIMTTMSKTIEHGVFEPLT